ncbi:uroporphyrinogen-III synthase [Bradyrhizobium sp. ISRA443]|uniref:uroporphyrinogen-III synthase n=1 Tax=unclassified Bradyrhizobium TaxID=2631580 RepID=UPI00247B1F8C|nr:MULTISPECIES: uroporphyrinogen-III synthase [unclassified Bradyrhizobium]WGR94726.1 uroporphyrinogen-III synthase [Bradyrhizobium sp. ISRA435]WGR99547.1 uroporphyrinogen-III synthase [Bradyrhizobium sp. ISRA436]WGS06437.1 uroporphyrinogen-III synthase [Bradyrhizobium sp. ISRA437]WGS13321.1 uroporphyrinogen-III synthase [Bradyrhizobium sp. ISRA443]
MAVLVTRPHPDNEATLASLRARGFDAVAAPMLRFEPLPFHDDDDAHYDAVILTSANALRAIDLTGSRLLRLPLFAVGAHTADAARAAGFGEVLVAKGDAVALRDLVLARVEAGALKSAATLLYLAGADLSRDLAGELGKKGMTVVTRTTYRMAPVASFPGEVSEAFLANRITAVLHYSRRSALAFLDAARAGGLEISALALPQCCISAAVALVLRDAGATQVAVAARPDESALLDALVRALRS